LGESDNVKFSLLKIPKRQFAKHMKLKKKEDQHMDTSPLLRTGNKIPMEGVTETKFGAETKGRSLFLHMYTELLNSKEWPVCVPQISQRHYRCMKREMIKCMQLLP
jgi:hypothetical protein